MEYKFEWGTLTDGDLGEFMSEIAEQCGIDDAIFLMERFGGMSLHVPKAPSALERPEDIHREDMTPWVIEVAQDRSLRLARMIVLLRGGEMVYIPAGRAVKKAMAREIKKLYNGRNAGELASRFKLSRRRVLQMARARKVLT